MSIRQPGSPRTDDAREPGSSSWPEVVSQGVAEATATVLARFGIEPDVLMPLVVPGRMMDATAPDRIAIAEIGRIMAACVARTECQHFGLLVGQGEFLTSLGLAGCLITGSQTVGEALENLVGHLHRHAGEPILTLVVEDVRARLSYVMPIPPVDGADQVADVALAFASNVLRTLCGADWVAEEVSLPGTAPADLSPFTRFYRSPVRFGAATAALAFPAELLGRPVAEGADLLRTLFAPHHGPRMPPVDGGLGEDVRRVLRARLLGQECSAETVAALFSMHRRTLNRHLHAEGLTFNTLVNEIRFELARRLMTNADMSLGQVASALAFSEMSAFTRAFRRWSGQTPSEWRAKHLAA